MPRRWGRSTGNEHEDAHSLAEATAPARSFGLNQNVNCKYFENTQHHEVCLSLEDSLPESCFPPAISAYRLKLRALWLRGQGLRKVDAAKHLQCTVSFLDECWNLEATSLKPPSVVPTYIAAYETRMLKAGVEPFREPVLRRAYARHLNDAYCECASSFTWEPAVFRKRNYETGDVAITDIAASRKDCSFGNLVTGLSHLDRVLSNIRNEFSIQDPGAYLMCNWYQDGDKSIAPHQHDFWSATLSFGAPRIFLLDGQPILLGHGDLLVFGTQRHSVPKMTGVHEGRISISIFWYPERIKADRSFQITLDSSLMEAALSSDELAAAVAHSVATELSKSPINVPGRGVGRHASLLSNVAEPATTSLERDYSEEGFLSEERLIEIALQVSLMEQ